MFNKIFTFLTLPRLLLCGSTLAMASLFTLYDPDYYWHLKSGEYIVGNWTLPHTDIFSYTMADQKWVLHEWLFQVILYGIHATMGEVWIKILSATAITFTIFSIFQISKRQSSGRISACCVILFFPLLIFPFMAPRPQIFSYLFFTFFIYAILETKYFHNKQALYFLPLIMIGWVNLHGGYIVGIALLMLYLATEFLSSWQRTGSIKNGLQTTRMTSIITMLTILAAGCNPDFFHHLLYPFQVMGMDASLHYISEWQSPDGHSRFGKIYILFTFIFFLSGILKKKSSDFTEILVPSFFLLQGFVAQRHIPIALLATTPFLCQNIKLLLEQKNILQTIDKIKEKLPSVRRAIGTTELGTKEYILNWVILFVGVLFFASTPSIQCELYQKVKQIIIPEQAVNFIEENNISGRLFNTYGYGGYLIYRLFPEQKVFIDGRADMYGDEFITEYTQIAKGSSQWQKSFDKYAIDYIICKNNTPLRQLVLLRGDFKLVYEDEYHSVLLKNITRFQDLISKHEIQNPQQTQDGGDNEK